MTIRKVTWVLGGAVIVALSGIGAVACSDSGSGNPTSPGSTDGGTQHDGNTGNNPGTDSGSNTQHDTGVGGGDDDGGPSDDGGAADCGKPGSLHPVEAGTGPYCPFSGVDGGKDLTCAFGQHCCEPSSGTGTCGSSCTWTADAGTDWACQGPANCPTGEVCCAATTGAGQDPGCTSHFLHKFTGTTCRTSCQSGELTVCEAQGDCTTGSCQVTKAKGANFGLCL